MWNNIIFGDVDASQSGVVDIAMNTVISGSIIASPVAGSIRHNAVMGPAAAGIELSGASASDNFIRGCTDGIHLGGHARGADDNVIEDCSGVAISGVLSALDAHVMGDTIRGCGAGLSVVFRRGLRLDVGHNTILSCTVDGATIDAGQGQSCHVEGNVVGGCGGRGLLVSGNRTVVRSNTVYASMGAGIEASGATTSAKDSVDHNISFGNAVGFQWDGPGTTWLGCNDWYGNTVANTQGITPGATDVDVDPQFCDVAGDDVFLGPSSPLLDLAGCGLVGAQPGGCAAPAAPVPARAARPVAVRTVPDLDAARVPSDPTSVVVPDDYATIQEALDSEVDTVLVRAGDYAEDVVMNRGGQLLMTIPETSPLGPRLGVAKITSLDNATTDNIITGFRITGSVEWYSGGTMQHCWLEDELKMGWGLTSLSPSDALIASDVCYVRNNIIFGDVVTGAVDDVDIALSTVIAGSISTNPAAPEQSSITLPAAPVCCAPKEMPSTHPRT